MQYALPGQPVVMRPCLRDIPSLPSWMYCFLAYVVMGVPDQATRDKLAYAQLVIREAQRHDGNSWLEYDLVFRQQTAIDHTLRWNTLQPGIQAATLVGHTSGCSQLCIVPETRLPGRSLCPSTLQQPEEPTTHTAGGKTSQVYVKPKFQPRK